MDKSSVAGIGLAVTGLASGFLLEGGHLAQLLQPTAALIVFGGTAGAVLFQFSWRTVMVAIRKLFNSFSTNGKETLDSIQSVLALPRKARRDGLLSLDPTVASLADPFLKEALMLAVDGIEPGDLRAIMHLALENAMEHEEESPAVFESAGGFSPTIGIIGAVLGLIQVMGHLHDINEVGRGIAIAFVSTVYGVAAANLVLLPAAGKLRARVREDYLRKEMILEGIVSMVAGMHPRMLEVKLRSFVRDHQRAPRAAA